MRDRLRTISDQKYYILFSDEICRGKYDGFYVEADDCSRYVECRAGLTRNLLCPDGTYFNGTYCMVGDVDECTLARANQVPMDEYDDDYTDAAELFVPLQRPFPPDGFPVLVETARDELELSPREVDYDLEELFAAEEEPEEVL